MVKRIIKFMKAVVSVFTLTLLVYAIIVTTYFVTTIFNQNVLKAGSLIKESDSFVATVIAIHNLEKAPKEHLVAVKKEGYKIVISDEQLDAAETRYEQYLRKDINIVGLCCPSEKIIYLSEDVSQIGDTVLHEFGHAIDLTNGYSKTAEFKECYDSEKDGIREYARQNAREYFAETYMLCCKTISSNLCMKYSFPETMEFLKTIQ